MTEQRERRPRWWLRILWVVVILAVLAGAGEIALRAILPGAISAAVRQPLELSGDHPVDVQLGGSVLLHTVTGRLGDVTVTVPDAPLLDGLQGDLTVHADSAPFSLVSGSGEVQGATASITVPKDRIDQTISLLTKGIAQTGTVREGALDVGRSMEIFGQKVSLSATLKLGVEQGDVRITPEGVKAAGFDLTAKQIDSFGGPAVRALTQPQTVCVRDQLPRGIELTGIELSSTGSVRVDAKISPTLVSDPKQREKGSCG